MKKILLVLMLTIPAFGFSQEPMSPEQQEKFNQELKQFQKEILEQMQSLNDSISKLSQRMKELQIVPQQSLTFDWPESEGDSSYYYFESPQAPLQLFYDFAIPVPDIPEMPLFQFPEPPDREYEFKLEIPELPASPEQYYYYQCPREKKGEWKEMLPFYRFFHKTSFS